MPFLFETFSLTKDFDILHSVCERCTNINSIKILLLREVGAGLGTESGFQDCSCATFLQKSSGYSNNNHWLADCSLGSFRRFNRISSKTV